MPWNILNGQDGSDPGWQSVETRDCLIMDTEYGLAAILPIGMSQVCSCNWEDSVRVGAEVEKAIRWAIFSLAAATS